MKKFTFEEVADRINKFNPDYELVEYINATNIILKYLPTGEVFKRCLSAFLKGSAHAPSVSKIIGLEKSKKTNLEKYGVENLFGNEEIRTKIKKTNLEKYGSEHPSQNKNIRDKVKQTNLERYGVEYSFQNKEVQEKAKKTNLERFGVENPSQNKDIKNKIKNSRIKSGDIRLIEGNTNKELSLKTQSSTTHLNRLFNKDIDILNYKKSDGTQIEQVIKSVLEQLGLEFEREKWFNGNKIRVDFYVPKFELIVEANGVYWHRTENKGTNYHYNRRKVLNELGLKVIQFNEVEILEDPIRIKYMIKDMIETGGKESYIYKDDCLIINLDYSIPPEGEILEEWIEEYDVKNNKLQNSGMLKIKS